MWAWNLGREHQISIISGSRISYYPSMIILISQMTYKNRPSACEEVAKQWDRESVTELYSLKIKYPEHWKISTKFENFSMFRNFKNFHLKFFFSKFFPIMCFINCWSFWANKFFFWVCPKFQQNFYVQKF